MKRAAAHAAPTRAAGHGAGGLAVAVALALVAGCHRHHGDPCAPGTRSTIELRNGSGALELALKGKALCDAHLRPVGTLERKKNGVVYSDAAGVVRLDLEAESPSAAAGRDAEGPALRLWRDGRELRVLRGDGVPLGSIAPQAIGALIYNPASSPIGKVERRDRDAVVTDMSGSAEFYLVPAQDAAAAGVFAIPTLEPAWALAAYLFWSR